MTVGGPRQFLASLLVPTPCPFHLPHQNCPQGQGCWVLVENEVPTWWGLLVALSWLLVSFSQAVLLMMVCWCWMDSREIYMNGAKLKLFCKFLFFFIFKEVEYYRNWAKWEVNLYGFFSFLTEWVTEYLKSKICKILLQCPTNTLCNLIKQIQRSFNIKHSKLTLWHWILSSSAWWVTVSSCHQRAPDEVPPSDHPENHH